jgi:surface carbohydrate biosynthesis protein (TIGR04326 family)
MPCKLRLVSRSRRLHETLGALCKKLALDYEWQRGPKWTSRESIPRLLYRSLPHGLRALISLVRYIRLRWPLRAAETSGWLGGDRSLFLCSYFLHLDSHQFESGRFYSHQWEALPRLLKANGIRTNWMQHYLESSVVPNPKVALRLIRSFNECSKEDSFQTFLDAYLSWRIVLRVLKRWAKLNMIAFRLRAIRHACCPGDSNIFLWPIIEDDWHASMRGSVAISNLLWVELFDVALKRMTRQKKGLYLCENQSWERALIHAWRKYKHGQLIAVVHSTVRFWDLRYSTDPRTVRSREPSSLPVADRIALNGPAAVEAYLSTGYPKDAIVECEALRYGYLADTAGLRGATRTEGNPIRVLVLGDFDKSDTIRMLGLLERAAPSLTKPVTYTLKPHPNYLVESAAYPSLQLRIVADPLPKIMQDADIAYAGNTTSAAVDAYLAGLPVVVMLDEMELNYSPLRGKTGVRFVTTPRELAQALEEAPRTNRDSVSASNDFFFLDPELPRWRRLLFAPDR